MKTGLTIMQLAEEVQRQSEAKKDFIADTRDLRMTVTPEIVDDKEALPRNMLDINGQGRFNVNENAHRQIATRNNIPYKYYERMMKEAPNLLARNVNTWMEKNPQRRMIRTLDGNARAFLSDRYRILDNDEVLAATLPVLSDLEVKIESSQVTEKKLYLKMVFPKVEGEIKKGDVVQAGAIISNSEIGHGSVLVHPFAYRLWCLNGATFDSLGTKRYHVGRAAGENEIAYQYYKDDTLKADDEAFMLKLRDSIRAAAEESMLETMINKMRETTERKIEGNPVKAVEVVQKRFNLLESETAGVLTSLINGADLTQYGMANAITDMSKSVESYDRATDLERMGGQLFEMPGKEWAEIAQAA
jgi:hypothetical protein